MIPIAFVAARGGRHGRHGHAQREPQRYLWRDNTWGEIGSGSKDGTAIGVPTR
jgi:hypothetical protein